MNLLTPAHSLACFIRFKYNSVRSRSIVILKLNLIYRSTFSGFFSTGLRLPLLLRALVDFVEQDSESDSLPPLFGVLVRKGISVADCREGLERGDFEDSCVVISASFNVGEDKKVFSIRGRIKVSSGGM